MKIKVTKEADAKYLDLCVAVRYEEEDMPNDAPLRDGDTWKAVIRLDDGVIENWPQGQTLSIENMKVTDQGTYILLDRDRREITRIDRDYAPNYLLPVSYGDYLSLEIDANGKITNWLKRPNLSDFENSEDD